MTVPDTTNVVRALAEAAGLWMNPDFPPRVEAVASTLTCENSFTQSAVRFAIETQMRAVSVEALESWIAGRSPAKRFVTAVLNAGNVPLVGFHDLLAVLAVGHAYVGVLSSKSPFLVPAFVATVRDLLPECRATFSSLDRALASSDLLLGSGASATMSEIRFRAVENGIPAERQLLRGTRYSVGILDGLETPDELLGFAQDVVVHDGRGCLNASMLFVPQEFDIARLGEACGRARIDFPPHPSTLRSLALEERLLRATDRPCQLQHGLLIVEGPPEPRRPGVVVITRYREIDTVQEWLADHLGDLQCVIRADRLGLDSGRIWICTPGQSQSPPLGWLQDGVDVIEFLTSA